MPYFVYKIEPAVSDLVKNLEMLQDFDVYKDAKNFAKEERSKLSAEDKTTYKIIFADNALQAEEQLMEKRDAPILREWEK